MPPLPIIPPWPGARVVLPDGARALCIGRVGDGGGFWACVLSDPDEPLRFGDIRDTILDLSDPDTLAAFDRRLALRLGAPEDQVADGVITTPKAFAKSVRMWRIATGGPECWARIFEVGDLTDPIEIRLRAWASVEEG